MQHGAVMHYNASTMRRHHQTVAVYNTYDYVVKHERNTVLLCGNRSATASPTGTYSLIRFELNTNSHVFCDTRNTVVVM